MSQGYTIIQVDRRSKRIYDWDVPADLQRHSSRLKKEMFGIGIWKDTHKKYLCIVHPELEHPIYIDARDLRG